ncbi:paraquat-inducible protein A [Paludibacterium yongneupense]|uniref:paraquat-inducible protein A n=1 Tax=Paludibacterium yongneupense TaxID=400061 RepID=UPI000688A889|nr:paraquat-inducible protein A [Paludibacterium yongneupense]
MDPHRHLVVFEHCDRVYQRPLLTLGQHARCKVCGLRLPCAQTLRCERSLALNLAAAITFAIVMATPVIHADVWGHHAEASLWQAAMALAQGGSAPIAIPVALILCVPLLQSLLQCWILVFTLKAVPAPGLAAMMRVGVWLRAWSMIEVCLHGSAGSR